MISKFPVSGEVVRVHFDRDTGGMFGYYNHESKQWWVQDAGTFRKAVASPIAWSPVSQWHDVAKTTPGDTGKDVLFYRSGDGATWVDLWAGRHAATHWTELPDPPRKPEFVVGGVYRIPGWGSVRITETATLNGTKYLFGTMGLAGIPNVWDETGHAVLFGADKKFDLKPLPA